MGGEFRGADLYPLIGWHHRDVTKPPTPEKLAGQLDRLELAQRSVGEVEPPRRLEWAAYRVILAAAGIDPDTLEWDGQRYDADDVRERLVEPLSHVWGYLHTQLPGFPPLHQTRWSPMFTLGNCLRQLFGLDHRLTSHHTGRYAPRLPALELRRQLLAKRRDHATQKDQ